MKYPSWKHPVFQAIHMHKTYDVLKGGSVKFLKGEYNLIAYGRFADDERIIVIVNNNNGNVNVATLKTPLMKFHVLIVKGIENLKIMKI